MKFLDGSVRIIKNIKETCVANAHKHKMAAKDHHKCERKTTKKCDKIQHYTT